MATRKVPLYGKPLSFTMVEEGATKGATLGVNLRWPDGRLVTAADFALPGQSNTGEIIAQQSIRQMGLLRNGNVYLSLAGDAESPGNSYYYGTDAAGVKGWHVLAITPPPVVYNRITADGNFRVTTTSALRVTAP